MVPGKRVSKRVYWGINLRGRERVPSLGKFQYRRESPFRVLGDRFIGKNAHFHPK